MVEYNELTASQQQVVQQVVRMYRVRHLAPKLAHRCTPLLVGPSGSGKTTTLRVAAQAVQALHAQAHEFAVAHVLELNCSSWIVSGAVDTPTWQVIQQAAGQVAGQNPLLIIILDEIDKLLGSTQAERGSANWNRAVMQEVQELVERQPRVLSRSRSPGLWGGGSCIAPGADDVIRNAWIMCAGAFQEMHMHRMPQAIGFGRNEELETGIAERHFDRLDADGMDVQLYSRLAWMSLPPPSRNDLQHAATGMIEDSLRLLVPDSRLEALVDQAIESITPMRELETLLLDEIASLMGESPIEIPEDQPTAPNNPMCTNDIPF